MTKGGSGPNTPPKHLFGVSRHTPVIRVMWNDNIWPLSIWQRLQGESQKASEHQFGCTFCNKMRPSPKKLEEAAAPPEFGARPRLMLLSMFRALGSIIGRKDAFAVMGRVGAGMLRQVQAGLATP